MHTIKIGINLLLAVWTYSSIKSVSVKSYYAGKYMMCCKWLSTIISNFKMSLEAAVLVSAARRD